LGNWDEGRVRQLLSNLIGNAIQHGAQSSPVQVSAEGNETVVVLRIRNDGQPIPAELVARMKAAEEFGKGFLARTQMFYAALALRFHLERPDDPTGRMLELYDDYSMIRPVPGTHFYAGFGHLAGYTSGYYTYMWSLVIAKDLFSAFNPDDMLDQGVAARYRDAVLAPGGSRDAADLVAEFLGRPYTTDAFAAWLNS
jgi:thimet oligopeptidase